MATNTLKTRIRHAYKTESEWASSNPVLLEGEVSYSSDKGNKYKIGDGTSTWSQLAYAVPVAKSDIGLGNVENKSSATIRGELTKENVTTALGYTPPTTDTKNTTGSTDTSSKIFLVGATSQSANPQTYSDNQVYVENGQLDANSIRIGEKITISYNSSTESIDFTFV